MHELSIALGIVKIAEDETQKAHATAVEKIELQIGALSGIELDALHYVWNQAVKDTVLEGAELEIDFREGKARCMDCDTEFPMEKVYDNCPKCRSYFKEVISGKELLVKALEVVT
jgi:hydrogenase nickel incorporation protein HypA/HybF